MRNSLFYLLFISSSVLLMACYAVSDPIDPPDAQALELNPTTAIEKAIGIGRIEPMGEIRELSVDISGVIRRLYKQENETVQAGELIADLGYPLEQKRVERIQARITRQQQQVVVERAILAENQVNTQNAQRTYERMLALSEKGAETQQALDDAEVSYQTARAREQQATARLKAAQLNVSELEADLAVAQAELQQKRITSPIDGRILEWKVREGEGVQPIAPIAQLVPEGKLVAVCEIDELLAERVRVGQSAIITRQGSSEPLFTGKVYFLSDYLRRKSLFADTPGEAEDRRVRVVKISLEEGTEAANVLLNSRVECQITLN